MGTAKTKRQPRVAPLPTLAGLWIRAFAVIRQPISFSGHSGLIVVSPSGDRREVGPVPSLAIGQSMRGLREIFLLHCTRTWEVLATQAGFSSVNQAKHRAESIYPGISQAWVATETSKPEAKAFERTIWHKLKCNFCGRIPPEFENPDTRVFSVRGTNICTTCVENFHDEVVRKK